MTKEGKGGGEVGRQGGGRSSGGSKALGDEGGRCRGWTWRLYASTYHTTHAAYIREECL